MLFKVLKHEVVLAAIIVGVPIAVYVTHAIINLKGTV
jgi:hypothetical protein